MNRDDGVSLMIVLFLVAMLLVALSVGWKTQRDEEKLCRHTIQRSFGKSSAEAQALIDETKAWEAE